MSVMLLCFIWSSVLESSGLLLSYSIIALRLHITIILIITLTSLTLKSTDIGTVVVHTVCVTVMYGVHNKVYRPLR